MPRSNRQWKDDQAMVYPEGEREGEVGGHGDEAEDGEGEESEREEEEESAGMESNRYVLDSYGGRNFWWYRSACGGLRVW